jgi:hypothetical protein
MPSFRDLVRFEPAERCDLPDFEVVQRNAHSEARSAFSHLLFGGDAIKVLGGWDVTPSAPPDAFVSIAAGTAVTTEEREDGTFEYGVTVGLEGDPSQVLDFTGKPNGTYGVWVRFIHTAGEVGNRVFWNATTGMEEVTAIDTRNVAGWDAQLNLVSPGTEYFKVASVIWGGATVSSANIGGTRDMFFEGDEGAGFPQVWGDGANDRSNFRGYDGLMDLYTWVHAVRRQLEDIIGGAQRWFEVPDYTLQDAQDHFLDTVDAHSSSPTWTGTLTLSQAPNFAPTLAGTARFSFHNFGWDVTATNATLLAYGPGDVGPGATESRYLSYGAANQLAPDIFLPLNSFIGQLRTLGTIVSFDLYWNHATAAGNGNAATRINWRLEKRTSSTVQGVWTTVASSFFNGGTEYGAAVNVGSSGAINYTPVSAQEEARIVLNIQSTAPGGLAPFVYGGVINYTTPKLFPT